VKLGRRPGAFVAFVDSYTEETILKIESDLQGNDLVSYRLYDSSGSLVFDSDGPQAFPGGLDVCTGDGESLLHLPQAREESITYRLYSPRGVLMTCSDGSRTQIFGSLRIEGSKHFAGRPPGPSRSPVPITRADGVPQ
jgi:hypothetical protein